MRRARGATRTGTLLPSATGGRSGFKNGGIHARRRNGGRARRRDGLLGINIGKNKDTPNELAASDYLFCLEHVYPAADYITVNISSPNTAGLRELQEEQALRRLIGTLRDEQERLASDRKSTRLNSSH